MLARCFTARKPQNDQFTWSRNSIPYAPCGPDGLFHEAFLPAPFRSRETVSHLSYYAILLRRYGSCSLSGRFCHLFLLANTLIWHTVIAHCYSSKTAHSRRTCFQPTQWKRYGSWSTAFSNVAVLYAGGKEIQLGVVWNVRVAPSCLGGTGALKNTHVSCADNSFSFYFVIQTKSCPRQQTRRQFERQPYFFANSLSLRETTHSPGSFSSHNDGSYKDLRTVTASLIVHLGPLSGSSPCW